MGRARPKVDTGPRPATAKADVSHGALVRHQHNRLDPQTLSGDVSRAQRATLGMSIELKDPRGSGRTEEARTRPPDASAATPTIGCQRTSPTSRRHTTLLEN